MLPQLNPLYNHGSPKYPDHWIIARAFAAAPNTHPMLLRKNQKISKIINLNLISQNNSATPPNGTNTSTKPQITLSLTRALGRARTKQGAQRRQIFSAEIFFFTTTMSFSDFSKVESLKSLNDFLADKSYVDGYVSCYLISPRAG